MPEARDKTGAAHIEGEGGGRRRRVLERIHRAAASRYAAVLLVAFFFGTAAAWLYNAANVNIDRRYVDELTVLRDASWHVPFGRGNLRIGEMNRWFARLLYPVGVYHMNRHMGGGRTMHKDSGWKENGFRYAGGYYLARHLPRWDREKDPNIQDFVFSVRLASGLIGAASFGLVLWALFGRFGFPGAATYGSLVLGSRLVFEQLQQVYSEATLFIVFNLAAFLYLRYGLHRPAPPSLRAAAWFGIVCAAALSTKLTGIPIVALLACLLLADARRQRHGPIVRIEICLLFFLGSLFLINFPYGSVFEYVTHTLDNVYNFSARHRLYGPSIPSFQPLADDMGILALLSSVPGVGWFVTLTFLAGLASLAAPPRRTLLPVYALGAAVVLVVWSFSNQMVYLVRNFASVYVAMSFVVSIAVGDLLTRVPKRKLAVACASPVLLLALLTTGAHLFRQASPVKETFFESIRGDLARCGSVAAIGFPDGDVRTLREAAGGAVVDFPRVPRYFHRNTVPYGEYKERVFAKYQEHDCLVVHREDHTNTKQVTNFFAPRYYALRERIGDFFLFTKWTEGNKPAWWLPSWMDVAGAGQRAVR